MELVKCIECGNDISDKAEICPHCGLAVNESLKKYEEGKFKNSYMQAREIEQLRIKKNFSVLFAIFAIIFVLWLLNRSEPTTTVVNPMEQAFVGDQHWALREMIKQNMHNPDSYEFVSGRRWQNDGKYFTEIYFRGTNGFGGVVTNNVVAELDSNGNIISISR